MKLYTVQPLEVLLKVKKFGALTSRSYILEDEDEITKFFLPSYKWMKDQMLKRLPHFKPNEETFPWWGWCRYGGKDNKPKFSEQYYRDLLKRLDEIQVIIELEIPDELVLLSDFDAWHFRLNTWFLGYEYEIREFEKYIINKCNMAKKDLKKPLTLNYMSLLTIDNEELRKEFFGMLNNNWERMFDLNLCPKILRFKKEHQQIQGNFWELKWEYVRSVKIKGGIIDRVICLPYSKLYQLEDKLKNMVDIDEMISLN